MFRPASRSSPGRPRLRVRSGVRWPPLAAALLLSAGCTSVERLSLLSNRGGSATAPPEPVPEAGGAAEPGEPMATGGQGAEGAGTAQPEATCGDGLLDAAEACDDGNDVEGDGCESSCQLSFGLEGQIGFSPVPLPVLAGENEDGSRAVFFVEQLDFTLPRELFFDLHVSGAHQTFPDEPGWLDPGEPVTSYYFHFDGPGDAEAFVDFSVAFPAEILAVLGSEYSLDQSDGMLGYPGLSYPTGAPKRGLDELDTITLSSSRRRLSAELGIGATHDSFRVLTRAGARPELVGSGNVLFLAPLEDVAEGVLEGPALALFREQSGVTLERALGVDLALPGTELAAASSRSVIPAGTRVTSYFIDYDPRDSDELVLAAGAVTFSGAVLGVASSSELIDESDDLGAAGTYYPTGADPGRGLELGVDQVRIADDGRSLQLSFWSDVGPDQVRVFVATP